MSHHLTWPQQSNRNIIATRRALAISASSIPLPSPTRTPPASPSTGPGIPRCDTVRGSTLPLTALLHFLLLLRADASPEDLFDGVVDDLVLLELLVEHGVHVRAELQTHQSYCAEQSASEASGAAWVAARRHEHAHTHTHAQVCICVCACARGCICVCVGQPAGHCL